MFCGRSIVVKPRLPKSEMWVRFPSPAFQIVKYIDMQKQVEVKDTQNVVMKNGIKVVSCVSIYRSQLRFYNCRENEIYAFEY